MADIARLKEIVEPEARALGFDLVRVIMMPSEAGDGGQSLQIMAEDPATGQLVIDQCAALSRRVSEAIDACEERGEVLIQGAYHLEVSSPGIDRPLTRAKDFANWAGHEARIVMVKGWDGDTNGDTNDDKNGDKNGDRAGKRVFKGILNGIEGDKVALTDSRMGEVKLDRQQIHSAKLVLTDELIAATQPLDSSGVDELVEEKADD